LFNGETVWGIAYARASVDRRLSTMIDNALLL